MTMIEKMAQAMAEATNGGKWYDGHYCDDHKKLWMDRARAALAVVRVPTNEMIAAKDYRGDQAIWDANCHYCGGPKENWNIMIDAALAEKVGG